MEPTWWNLIPSYFDGTAFTLGSFPVRWYGIMYIFAFVTGYLTLMHVNKKEKLGYTKDQFDSLFTWIIAGIIIGARLGYVRRTEGHGISAQDWAWTLDFADRALSGAR